MHIVIHRNDGSVQNYRQSYFPSVHKGETMEVTTPAVRNRGFRHAALTFVLYHCEVEAYCGKERIYSQESLEKGQQIGGRRYMISLPYDYQNQNIRIVAVNRENDSFSSFENVKIVPDVKSLYSLESGQTFSFILFLTLLAAWVIWSSVSRFIPLWKEESNRLFIFLCS